MISRTVTNGFVNNLGPCKVMSRQCRDLREEPFLWFNVCSSAEPVALGLFPVALGLFMCLYLQVAGGRAHLLVFSEP